jgi:hypothetical protein
VRDCNAFDLTALNPHPTLSLGKGEASHWYELET